MSWINIELETLSALAGSGLTLGHDNLKFYMLNRFNIDNLKVCYVTKQITSDQANDCLQALYNL